MVRKIGLAALLMTVAGAASASPCKGFAFFCDRFPPVQITKVQAPEIDPASAMAGLTMLAGGLAVLRGRRSKKTEA